MLPHLPSSRNRLLVHAAWLVLLVALSACAGGAAAVSPSGTPPPTDEFTQTATLSPTGTPSPPPTSTFTPEPSPTSTSTPTPTPIPLAGFDTNLLLPGVEPAGYIEDTCQYLNLRWRSSKAAPGTIVVPVMYHSVVKDGRPLRDNMSVSAEYFRNTMRLAHQLGFETITTNELISFLYHNEYIPPRSLLLIVDDRRQGVVTSHFMPVLEEYDWTVTMAYITGVATASEWASLEELNETGLVDIQVHGFFHNGQTYFTEHTPQEIVHQELFDPIPLYKQHFGYVPRTFIWPGGNFTDYTVDVARQAGYQAALTVYSRGPLMFNWIPLGEPEREVGDPLMVLPRFWSTAATVNLNTAVQFAEQAVQFAEENRSAELDWYATNCAGYPSFETPAPPFNPQQAH